MDAKSGKEKVAAAGARHKWRAPMRNYKLEDEETKSFPELATVVVVRSHVRDRTGRKVAPRYGRVLGRYKATSATAGVSG